MTSSDDDETQESLDPPPTTGGGGCLLALGVLVLLLVTALPLYFATTKFIAGWQAGAALRTLSADEAGRGRAVVFHGHVRGSAIAKPSRENAAGFIGEVGHWVRSGKSSTYAIVCTITRLDGIQIEGSGSALTVNGYNGRSASLAHGLALAPGAVAVDFTSDGPSSSGLPDDVAKVCGLQGTRSIYFYKERVIREGDEAVVRGCRVGDVIVPCYDGIDFVTSRRASDMARDTKDEIAPTLLFASFLALLGLGIAGLLGRYNVTGRKRVRSS